MITNIPPAFAEPVAKDGKDSAMTYKNRAKGAFTGSRKAMLALMSLSVLASCADAEGPRVRAANIPAPMSAKERQPGVNENSDAVMYLPLGKDVLMPEAESGEDLPSTIVGPFELRSETVAGALQLILDGTNIPVAFETNRGLENTITVTNLKGPLNNVVHEVCSLADLYCSYQNGVLSVKDTEIFSVTIPPIAASDQVGTLLTNISAAIGEITGSQPISDPSTRTIVYRATQRTSEVARRYFQRLRQNTALIIFETYIWEVSLGGGNTTGINWSKLDNIGKFNFGIDINGTTSPDFGTPISIGLPTTGPVNFATGDVFNFISQYGAVKTISQPQITVLSGSQARLRVADTQNYLASVSRTTTDGGNTTTSTTTDSVDSGFTLEIGSNWDKATVYGDINILLQEVRGIERFEASDDAAVQLPNTTERELQTQVRVRPGDSLLIAGLVREIDNLDSSGPGLTETFLPTSRTTQAQNVELVFLLRPRVIVFTSTEDAVPADQAKMAAAGNPLPIAQAAKLTPAEKNAAEAAALPVAVPVEAADELPPLDAPKTPPAPTPAPLPVQQNEPVALTPKPQARKISERPESVAQNSVPAEAVEPAAAAPPAPLPQPIPPRAPTAKRISQQPTASTAQAPAANDVHNGIRYSDVSSGSTTGGTATNAPAPAPVERVTETYKEVPLASNGQ